MVEKEGFRDRVALITGGASGIGRALGEELAKRGAEVFLADRQIEVATEVAAQIRGAGGRAHALELDVRDHEAFGRVAKSIVERSGRIDYFFNNAGIGVGGPIERYRIEDWDDVFDVNLRGVAYGIQAVYPIMIAQGSGHIVNTASLAGILPGALEGSYGATKHAVVGLSRTLRIEARRHGVRVSALCPGVIRTPILSGGRYGRFEGPSEEKLMEIWERLRPMEPDVFAKKVLAAVRANEQIIVIPRWWKAIWWLDRASPALSLRIWGEVFERVLVDLVPKQEERRSRTNQKIENVGVVGE